MTRTTGKAGRSRGVATVEFALVLIPFLLLLLGIIEMGRALFTYNSAVEATRRGARTAVVSAIPANRAIPAEAVLAEMQAILPDLDETTVRVRYLPLACVADCAYVEVQLQNYTIVPLLWPIAPITLPPLTTTLPVESLGDN